MPWVKGRVKASGWAVGQNMYTPIDIVSRVPDPTDRPYGGLLYFASVAETEGHFMGKRRDLHRYELNLGVIGPPSLAEGSQKIAHEVVFAQRPNGWDHQISTKLAASVLYDWKMEVGRLKLGSLLDGDLVTDVGLALGSVISDTHVGAMARFGINADRAMWPERIRPVHDVEVDAHPESRGAMGKAYDGLAGLWGFVSGFSKHEVYVFGSTTGKIVLGNIFIDEALPLIKREYFVGDVSFGVVVGLGRLLEISYQQIHRTKEFRTQEHSNSYGSISIVWLQK
jgi:hypothetical protein